MSKGDISGFIAIPKRDRWEAMAEMLLWCGEWDETTQGSDFWAEVHDEFMENARESKDLEIKAIALSECETMKIGGNEYYLVEKES